MGVDIHTSVEVFNKDASKYERKCLYYKDDNGNFKEAWSMTDNRNYELFGRLAGVRSYSKPFVRPRGLPDDISDETKELYGSGEYYFNATWYDYCELKLYSKTDDAYVEDEVYDDDNGFTIVDSWNGVEQYINAIDIILEAYGIYYPVPGEVRIVIWFDA